MKVLEVNLFKFTALTFFGLLKLIINRFDLFLFIFTGIGILTFLFKPKKLRLNKYNT